jgi:hypothetical protein
MTRASGAAPAVLLMASSGGDAGELRELLGPGGAADLASALNSEAERWASRVAPGHVFEAREPLAEATLRVLSGHPGPLLVVWPVLARLRDEHAEGALGDLRAGCELVLGPLIDGGLYLLGLARPLAELVSAPDPAWAGPDAMTTAFAAAAAGGFEGGILRAERALRRPSDVRAALADPLTPQEIAAILSARLFSGRRRSF